MPDDDASAEHRELERLFHEALGRPHPERDAFLAAACPDPALRARVARLLAIDADLPDSFLDGRPPADPGDGAPRRLGDFTLRRLLGEGGMGAVYEAEQSHPRRLVALKVIRAAIATPTLVRRFEREVAVLARLNHPGIAHIYEAGRAEGVGGQSVPYLAMEFVDGERLTEFVRSRNLTVAARLDLMAQVCDAVQHAHERGVIHRDLKPGNILVVPHRDQSRVRVATDAGGVPKVLDFGIARLAEGTDGPGATVQTERGQVIGTLPYMSPEQVEGRPELMDHRCDIYALGAILYELLAGRPPLDVRDEALADAARVIREEDPSRLSTFNTAFRGDVETIVGKAIEKDPSRRYESAAALAADIRRHLRDEPIVARPSSALYQLRKFTKRNRALVLGALGIFLAVCTGAVIATMFALREADARRAGDRLLYRTIIDAASLALSEGNGRHARALLERAPAEHRGWEWRRLLNDIEQSLRVAADSALVDAIPIEVRDDVVRFSAPGRVVTWSLRDNAVTSAPDEFLVRGGDASGVTTIGLRADGKTAALPGLDGRVIPLPADGTVSRIGISRNGEAGFLTIGEPGRSGFRLVSFDCEPIGWRARSVASDVDNFVFASASDGRLALIDLPIATLQILGKKRTELHLALDPGMPTTIAVSPDARLLAIGRVDGRVELRRSPDGTLVRTSRVQGDAVRSIAFDPSGAFLVTGGEEGLVRVLRVEDGQRVATLRGHDAAVRQLVVAAAGDRLVTVDAKGSARIWRWPAAVDPDVIDAHTNRATAVAFSPDGTRVASAGEDRFLRVWDADTGELVSSRSIAMNTLKQLAWRPDGQSLAVRGAVTTSRDGTEEQPVVEMLDMPTDAKSPRWSTSVDVPISWSRGGMVLYQHPTNETGFIAVATPGKAIGYGGQRARSELRAPLVDDDVRFAVRQSGDALAIVDLERASARPCAGARPFLVPVIRTRSDGRAIVVAGDASVPNAAVVIDAETGVTLGRLAGHFATVRCAAVGAGGTRIVTGSDDRTAIVWDATTFEPLATLRGHNGPVNAVDFSPNGETLATASSDGTLRLWNWRGRPERVGWARNYDAHDVPFGRDPCRFRRCSHSPMDGRCPAGACNDEAARRGRRGARHPAQGAARRRGTSRDRAAHDPRRRSDDTR
jgi:WD40 repeat protein